MYVTLLSAPTDELLAGYAAKICTSEKQSFSRAEMTSALKCAIDSGHLSVIEHLSFTFLVEGISRVCSHQLVRHRLASFSQQSQRYVDYNNLNYVFPDSIRNNKIANRMFEKTIAKCIEMYKAFIKSGIKEEDARFILPEATTTNIVMTMNARELLHFLNLRLCNRAQWEIRELAEKILKIVYPKAPMVFANAGPECVCDRCKELKSCGRMVDRKREIGRIKEGN